MFENKIIAYGAGECARVWLESTELKGKVDVFVVGKQYLREETLCGIPIKSDEYLMECEEDYELVFTTQYFEKIYYDLVNRNVLSNEHLKGIWVRNTMGIKPICDGDIVPPITSEEWQWIEKQFEDNSSLELLSHIKKERQSPDYPSKQSFVPIETGFHNAGLLDYWETVSGRREHENVIVIEAGTYIGDTIDKLVKNSGGIVSDYYALEPAHHNFEIIKNMKPENIKNFIPMKVALGKEVSEVEFRYTEDNYFAASYTGTDRENACRETIKVIPLDSLQLKDEADYFWKMDIEGAELNALMGGKEFIKKNRPNLAVCLYHKNRDIIEIPKFLKSLVPDYEFYLVGGSHTILLAK